MNHPLLGLATIGLAVLLLSALFADVQDEVEDPEISDLDKWMAEQAAKNADKVDLSKIDPSKIPPHLLPDPGDKDIDLSDFELPEDLDITLPEGSTIDGDTITLGDDMDIVLPPGTLLHDFEMDFPRDTKMEIPKGAVVNDDTIVFPPGSVVRLADGTIIPLPQGGTLTMPGRTQADIEADMKDGVIDVPAGSKLSAPVIELPMAWPLTLPKGTKFQLPPGMGLPPGRLDEDTPYTIPAGTEFNYPGKTGSGGGGTDGDDDGGGGTTKPPTKQPSQYRATVTDITESPSSMKKGRPITVRGYVKTGGSGLADAPVRIFLNETKTTPGTLIGDGKTGSDGTFSITAQIPSDLPPRDYQLVAQHVGTIRDDIGYRPSWSDPPLTVTDDATLSLDIPERVGVGSPTNLRARLTDTHGAAIVGAPVRVDVRDSPRVLDTLTTDGDGWVLLLHSFRVSRATVEVRFQFEGDAHVGATQETGQVQIVDLGFHPDGAIPIKVRTGEPITVRGTLKDGDKTQWGERLRVSYPGGTRTGTTDGQGSLTVELPGTATTGRQQITVSTERDGFRVATIDVVVQAPITLTHTFPGYYAAGGTPWMDVSIHETTSDGDLVIIRGTQDGQGDLVFRGGIRDVSVVARDPATGDETRATTDKDGVARVALPVSGTARERLTLTVRETDHHTGASAFLDATPAVLTATAPTTVERGVQTDIDIRLTAATTDGRALPELAAGKINGLKEASLAIGGRTVTVPWISDQITFPVKLASSLEPGPYRAVLTTDLPGHEVEVPIEVVAHIDLELGGLPRQYDEGKPFSFNATARRDDGAALAGVTLTAVFRSDGKTRTVEAVTDERGVARFTAPRSILGGEDLRLTVSSPAGTDYAPQNVDVTITTPVEVLLPLLLAIGALVLGAGAYAAWWLRRRHGSVAEGLRQHDPRPAPDFSYQVVGRPEGLPLAAAPGQELRLAFRVAATAKEEKPGKEAEPTDEAPSAAGAAIPADIALTVGDKAIPVPMQAGAGTATLPGLPPGEHAVTIQVRTDRRHRVLDSHDALRVATWAEHVIHDYETLRGAAERALVDLPKGFTGRMLESGLVMSLTDIPKGMLADAITTYEMATYSTHPVTEADWIRFATFVTKTARRLERRATVAEGRAADDDRLRLPLAETRGRAVA